MPDPDPDRSTTPGLPPAGRAAGRWFDLPPLWLLLCLGLAFGLDRLWPVALFGSAGRLAGAGLILAGVGLTLAAVLAMARARTTVIPHRAPTALVTGGVFGLSRNPIYLGDVLILTGAILWLDAPLALPLVPAFARLIAARFIAPEEARLKAAFGPQFDAWSARVRRWI
jgi:protein-S-isoprenylcysteine O-methyltransferase Ste14